MSFFSKIFSEDYLKPLAADIKRVNELEQGFSGKSQEDLRNLTTQWKQELKKISEDFETTDDRADDRRRLRKQLDDYLNSILPQAFAAVRETAKRTLGQRHFDVQLLGGMTLHRGRIAEMKTGEGKTLAATSAVYLNALVGRGVHLVTVNDYLSRRDASWMGQIYNYLGLSVGVIQHEQSFKFALEVLPQTDGQLEQEAVKIVLDVKNLAQCSRREAYGCDVTYGTNNEFGFDYLRDNMVASVEQKSQRELYYAIVDEVDSILIDEARTPLIISAPDTTPTDQYFEFAKLVQKLTENEDYTVDLKKKSAVLTEPGISKLEKMLGIENIYVEKGVATVHHIEQALRARSLFKKDRDYVVREGQVVIVDEFTGRMLPGRRYSEGLHQAIEAKEGVAVERESKTMATITFQNYFRLYAKLSGMTGTASTEAEEFRKIYSLEVVEIPTNKPMVRKDLQDSVYKTESGKNEALAREIKSRFDTGQPILIGTVSIEKNELISGVLRQTGIPHEILNAKNHEQEAKIIAQAGRFKAVVLATNIAGRGVDIILGGFPYNEAEAKKVRDLGGLHIIGTERHESRRIDNQLRGRSGRQGDPGSSQFFVSLEDDVIRLFGGDRVQKMMTTLGVPDDMPIEHGLVSKVIESAQKKIEGLNFDIRKHVLEFDDVMNKHREVIYRIRDRVLQEDANLKDETLQKIEVEINNVILAGTHDQAPAEWKLKKLYDKLLGIFPYDSQNVPAFSSSEKAVEYFTDLARKTYETKETQITASIMRAIERTVTLQAIDSLWMEHLDTMDHLRDSVRLRGYAQRDPLVEYKREGFELFQSLLAEIDKAIVYMIYKVELRSSPDHQHVHNSAQRFTPAADKVGRNDPCPCGAVNPETGQIYKWKK
ncbi:MAG: preprotein translocase subunit SecA, partial [bacterium]|nr:preprotein translocase subunit SecA [bacterium]